MKPQTTRLYRVRNRTSSDNNMINIMRINRKTLVIEDNDTVDSIKEFIFKDKKNFNLNVDEPSDIIIIDNRNKDIVDDDFLVDTFDTEYNMNVIVRSKTISKQLDSYGINFLNFKDNVMKADFYSNLEDANLSYSNLNGANLEGANLEGVNLSYSNLKGVNLEGASLAGANLFRADLTDANLSRVDLSHVNLNLVKFINSILDNANLEGADLTNANIENASINNTNFFGASLTDVTHIDTATYNQNTPPIYENADLSGTYLDKNFVQEIIVPVEEPPFNIFYPLHDERSLFLRKKTDNQTKSYLQKINDALIEYTKASYIDINNALREGGCDKASNQNIKEMCKTLSLFIEKDENKIKKKVVVYRGVKSESIDDYIRDTNGSISKVFFSTTTNREVASYFAKVCCVLEITLGIGVHACDISRISAMPEEKEILIGPGGIYKYTGKGEPFMFNGSLRNVLKFDYVMQ